MSTRCTASEAETGETCLANAVKNDRVDEVREAVMNGGLDTRTRKAALIDAAYHGAVEVGDLLASHVTRDDLFVAVQQPFDVDDPRFIEMLIDRVWLGPDAAVDDGQRVRLLHLTSHYGAVAICDRLLARGADPDAETVDGDTPLHVAAERNEPAILERLLAYGADPDRRSNYNASPYDVAAPEAAEALQRYREIRAAGGERLETRKKPGPAVKHGRPF